MMMIIIPDFLPFMLALVEHLGGERRDNHTSTRQGNLTFCESSLRTDVYHVLYRHLVEVGETILQFPIEND